MFTYGRRGAKYNDWYWFPEMNKFSSSAYGIGFFGSGEFGIAQQFQEYIGSVADQLNISRQDGWQKVLNSFEENNTKAADLIYKETPSAYR